MEYQEYENFITEAHQGDIIGYTREQHLEEIAEYEKAIDNILDEIKKFKSEGEYAQACIWCSFLKTVDRKMNNHFEELYNMQVSLTGGNS